MKIDWLDFVRERAQVNFSRSSGAGGQNVNKVNTKAQLSLDLKFLEDILPSGSFQRVTDKLKNRITQNHILQIFVQDHRSQGENLQLAYHRMAQLLQGALLEKRPRKPTGIPKSSKVRRLETKRLRGMVKRQRNQLD